MKDRFLRRKNSDSIGYFSYGRQFLKRLQTSAFTFTLSFWAYWGGQGRWTKEKKNGPVWFTLNPSVKIHRETQKNDFFNKY